MVARGIGGAEPTAEERFQLERFIWIAPDRMRVSGRFLDLAEVPTAAPQLVVRGNGAERTIPATGDSAGGSVADGEAWRAEFQWQDPPIPFDVATLTFGGDLSVPLPQPGTRLSWLRPQILPVHRDAADPDAAESRPAVTAQEAPPITDAASQADPSQPAVPSGAISAHADLIAAREEAHTLRTLMARRDEALARAVSDAEAEQRGRAEDAERFRQELAALRASAEEALAARNTQAEGLAAELEKLRGLVDAREAEVARLTEELEAARELVGRKDEELAQLQAELEAATVAHDQTQAAQQGEYDALRTQLAQLQGTSDAIGQAREDAQRLLDRLSAIGQAANPAG